MSECTYVGSELDVFAHAVNWKTYLRQQLRPYLKGSVAEVGAGIGSTTQLLCDGLQERWLCLEPDPALAQRISRSTATRSGNVEVRVGTLQDLAPHEKFDAILYIDVLEHIEHDADEMTRAASYLGPNGVVVVLSPAHQWLFTPFDQAIGHFRRYTRKTLRAAMPPSLQEKKLVYLDSCGMLASLGNRLLLRSAEPQLSQIKVWDRALVPMSRLLDPVFAYRVGKSVLGVYERA